MAQDEGATDELDDVLAGFDVELVATAQTGDVDKDSRWSFSGFLGLGTSYNFAHDAPDPGKTDWRGLSRLRLTLELEAGLRLSTAWELFVSGHAFNDFVYAINGRDDYTTQVLDQYENELELNDTFVAGRLGRGFFLRAGRQVVAWGTSETIRVTDILNPLDLREPGLTDIENLRLPVAMTRLDWVSRTWTVSGMAIHEIRFDKSPVYGNDFFPFAAPLPPDDIPASTLENTEYALSARGSFRGWDLSLYWADVFDDTPHLELAWPRVELKHSRLQMVGAATGIAVGDWLIKGEGAHLRGLEFAMAPGETFFRTDLLAGVEYFGWNDTSVTVEAVVRHIHDFDPILDRPPDFAKQDRFEWVVRFSRMLFNQTLTLSLVAITSEIDGSGGGMQRLEARYDISDRLEMVGGVVFYSSGDAPGFEDIGDNDRLFLDLAYRF